LVLVSSCREIGGGVHPRVLLDWDVLCRAETQVYYKAACIVLLLCIPVGLGLTLRRYSKDLGGRNQRRIVMPVTCGYTPDAYFWETFMMLRTGLLVMCAQHDTLALRCAIMCIVLWIFLGLNLLVKPFDGMGRFALSRFDMVSHVGVLLMIALSMVVMEELDNTLYPTQSLLGQGLIVFLGACVVLFNIYCVLFAILRMLVVTVCDALEAIVEDGGSTSYALEKGIQMIQMLYGMNPVLYYKDSITGQYIIDDSQLNWSERQFLMRILLGAISACTDSSTHLHTWLVERAIHEAFTCAVEARKAKLAHLYCLHGSKTRSLIPFIPFLEVTMRNPDIELEKEKPYMSVTLEELYVAMREVNYNVMEHTSGLYKEPEKPQEEEEAPQVGRDRAMDHVRARSRKIEEEEEVPSSAREEFFEELQAEGAVTGDEDLRQPTEQLLKELQQLEEEIDELEAKLPPEMTEEPAQTSEAESKRRLPREAARPDGSSRDVSFALGSPLSSEQSSEAGTEVGDKAPDTAAP